LGENVRKELFYTTILAAIAMVSSGNPAYSQTPPTIDNPTAMTIDKVESELRPEERVLDHVARARIALTNANTAEATKELDMAIAELGNVKEDNKNMQIQVISFDYGKTLITKSISIPITGSKATFDSIMSNIKSIDMGNNSITSSKVEYILFNSSRKDLEKDLKDAKQAVASNNSTLGDFNLVQWRARGVSKKNKDIPYLEKTGANIALARVMLQQKYYDAARSAVDEAESSLKEYRSTLKDANQKKQFGLMDDDLKAISKEIKKKDPSLIEKLDNSLDKWWQKVNS
jgi:hypothetical protein